MKSFYRIASLMMFFAPIISKELSFDHKFNQTSGQLSLAQQFQLQYLQQNLARYHDQVIQYWTLDENVRILIEMTELAVQESSVATQPEIKQKIIEVFQKFNIHISFTSDDFIQKSNVTIKNNQNSIHKLLKKSAPFKHRKPFVIISETQPEKPAKIHGANRTRKKLARARKERENSGKKSDLIEKIKRDFFQKTALDQRNENEKNKNLDTIIQAKEEYLAKIISTKNNKNDHILAEMKEIGE